MSATRRVLLPIALSILLVTPIVALLSLNAHLGAFGPAVVEVRANTPYDDVFSHRRHWDPEVVHAFFRRLSPLQEALPRGEVVGYVTDARKGQRVLRRTLAQSALPPAIVAFDADRPLVVADFRSERALRRFVAQGPWRVRAHPRPGLALLARSPTRRGAPFS